MMIMNIKMIMLIIRDDALVWEEIMFAIMIMMMQ